MSSMDKTQEAAQLEAAAKAADQLKADMAAKLRQLGLPFEKLTVFGRIYCNVHVVCVSRTTAQKWTQVLGTVFPGAKVGCIPHNWRASENKGTNLRPTLRSGFLVSVAA